MHRLFPNFVGRQGAVGLLLVRLVTGTGFVLHGWPKIQKPLEWMPPEMGVPGIFQALAAVSEFAGGIALILGLLTPIAAFGIACTMAVAIKIAHLDNGHSFVASGQPSFELPAAYLAIAVMLILVGPGMLSADACLFRKNK